MDLTGYGLLAALAAFMLFVWGHAIGYAQGHEDGVREQERHASYGAASDAMEPLVPLHIRQAEEVLANALADDERTGA